MLLAHEPQKHQ